jgi:hypothetical protein
MLTSTGDATYAKDASAHYERNHRKYQRLR